MLTRNGLFFFQAEDGIRDGRVTGVQTCAFRSTSIVTRSLRRTFGLDRLRPGQREVIEAVLHGRDTLAIMPTGAGKSLGRSEERRVGKECRSRWSPGQRRKRDVSAVATWPSSTV